MMNLEQMKSFLSVANTGSYSAAAKERFLSQPAISNQMKMLEEELGVKLFLRNLKNVTLTEQGYKFKKYANQMIATEKDMLNSLKEPEAEHYGMMDIVAPWLTCTKLMDDFFAEAIKQRGKEVVYRVYQREDTDIPQMVANGEIEIGIANYMIPNKNLVYEKGFTEEIVLITPNEERYRHLNPEQLRELLLTEGHIRYDFGGGNDFLWNDFFGKVVGRDLHNIKTVANTAQYSQQLAAVEAGLGIGFISTSCMQKEWRSGRVLAYRCKGLLEKTHYVIYDKARAECSELLRHTKDLLIEKLRESTKYPEESF